MAASQQEPTISQTEVDRKAAVTNSEKQSTAAWHPEALPVLPATLMLTGTTTEKKGEAGENEARPPLPELGSRLVFSPVQGKSGQRREL